MHLLTCLHQLVLRIRIVTSGGRGGDTWAFSRKGKLGGSEVFIGERGGRHCPNISKLKVGHAAGEMVTVYSRY